LNYSKIHKAFYFENEQEILRRPQQAMILPVHD